MLLALVLALTAGETQGLRQQGVEGKPRAHLAIVNAVLPTLAPGTDTVVIDGGRVVALHSSMNGPPPSATKTIDAQGRIVLPGLIDSHIHFASGGISETQVRVQGSKTPALIIQRIVDSAAAHPSTPWIVGRGFSYDAFQPGYPTRHMLDAIDRPVFIYSYDSHTGWANSKAPVGT